MIQSKPNSKIFMLFPLLMVVLPLLLTGCIPFPTAITATIRTVEFDASELCDAGADELIVINAKTKSQFFSENAFFRKEDGGELQTTNNCKTTLHGYKRKTGGVGVAAIDPYGGGAGVAKMGGDHAHYILVKFPGGDIYGIAFSNRFGKVYQAGPDGRISGSSLVTTELPFFIEVRVGTIKLKVREVATLPVPMDCGAIQPERYAMHALPVSANIDAHSNIRLLTPTSFAMLKNSAKIGSRVVFQRLDSNYAGSIAATDGPISPGNNKVVVQIQSQSFSWSGYGGETKKSQPRILAFEAIGRHKYLIKFKLKSKETLDAWIWIFDAKSKTVIVGEHPELGHVGCFVPAIGQG